MVCLCWSVHYSPQLRLIMQIKATAATLGRGLHSPPPPGIILTPSKQNIASLESPLACFRPQLLWRGGGSPLPALGPAMGMVWGRKLPEQRQEGMWHYLFPREWDETTWEWDKGEGKQKSIISSGSGGQARGFFFATDFALTLLNPLHTGPLTLEKRTQISRWVPLCWPGTLCSPLAVLA